MAIASGTLVLGDIRREGDSLTIRLEPADPQQAADEFKLDLDRDE